MHIWRRFLLTLTLYGILLPYIANATIPPPPPPPPPARTLPYVWPDNGVNITYASQSVFGGQQLYVTAANCPYINLAGGSALLYSTGFDSPNGGNLASGIFQIGYSYNPGQTYGFQGFSGGANIQITNSCIAHTENYNALNTTGTMTIDAGARLWCDYEVHRSGNTELSGYIDTDQPQDGFYNDAGTVNMYNGSILGATGFGSNGQGHFQNSSIFNMYGGTINSSDLNHGYRYNNGTFTQFGGTIGAGPNGNPFFYNDGTYIYNGGTITTNIFNNNTVIITQPFSPPGGLNNNNTLYINQNYYTQTGADNFSNAANLVNLNGPGGGAPPVNYSYLNGSFSTAGSINVGFNNAANFSSTGNINALVVNVNTVAGVGSTFTMNHTMTGSVAENSGSTFNLPGILVLNGPNGYRHDGTLSYTGTIRVNGTSLAAPIFSNTGQTLTGSAGSSLIIGPSLATNFTINMPVSGVQNISLVTSGSQFTSMQPITSLGAGFTVANGTTATINAGLSGAGNVSVGGGASGAMNINNSALAVANVTVNVGATLTFNGTSATATNQSPITNAGTVTFTGTTANSGPIINNNILSVAPGATLANSSTITSGATLANNGLINNTGTMTLTGTISGTGTISNKIASFLNMTNITNSNGISNDGRLNLSGNILGASGVITNNRTSSSIFGVVNMNTVNITNAFSNNGVTNVTGSLAGTNIFNNAPGIMNMQSITNSATINNSGNIVFSGVNVNTGAITNNPIGFITINGASSLKVTGLGTIPGLGTILGAGNASTFIVDNIFFTQGNFKNIEQITINAGKEMHLFSGGQISGFKDLDIEGGLFIGGGSFLLINAAQFVHGNGSIDNDGTITLDSANLLLGGHFINNSTGVFEITGTPSITFNGAVFTNSGEITGTFNAFNGLPRINIPNATPDLINGVLVIGYQHNYIASGTYTFIHGIGTATIGGKVVPLPSTYITSFNLVTSGGDVNVQVVRKGFDKVATDPVAKQVGALLELFGANNPTGQMLDLLNALEKITDVAQLNAALLSLNPPEYVPLQSLDMLQYVISAVHSRLAESRLGYASGDVDRYNNGAWIRPFSGSAHQKQKNNLQPYSATTHGFALGVDNQITPGITLGIGGSIAKAKVNDGTNISTKTDISSYQALIYGTLESNTFAYLDWIVSAGVNHYDGTRKVHFSTYTSTANARYSGQQLTIKAIASKNYMWRKYLQLTPMASAQYSFLRQLAYTESGAGPFNNIVNPSNINLMQLGVGGQIAVPLSEGVVTSIPEVHAMALVDAKGGNQKTNSQFAVGGPILTQTVKAGRLIGQVGASISFLLTDRVQAVFDYDYEWRQQYRSHEMYLNLRYVF
jgi:outer membrane autotransporter protein